MSKLWWPWEASFLRSLNARDNISCCEDFACAGPSAWNTVWTACSPLSTPNAWLTPTHLCRMSSLSPPPDLALPQRPAHSQAKHASPLSTNSDFTPRSSQNPAQGAIDVQYSLVAYVHETLYLTRCTGDVLFCLRCDAWSCSSHVLTMRERPTESKRQQYRHCRAAEPEPVATLSLDFSSFKESECLFSPPLDFSVIFRWLHE